MYARTVARISRSHLPKPLVVRGGLGRTFGSLVSFLAIALLASGAYLLEDAFAHPVEAYPAALITAAFAIALSLLLLFFLFKPRRGTSSVECGNSDVALATRTEQVVLARSPRAKLDKNELRRDLAYQRVYVDPSLIRP